MPVASATGPKIWRMTVDRYDRLTELGWFHDQRVELMEGRIVRMAAQLEPHVACVSLAAKAVARAFGNGYYVRFQAPLVQGKFSKPEPDLAVVRGTERGFLQSGTPTTALLVIEVSDTTLRQDRGRKAGIYARSGIADYWIINLVDRRLEIHRDPVRHARYKSRFGYASIQVVQPGGSIAPLAAPHVPIAVNDLLP